MKKVVKQIERKIDVVKAHYYTDSELFHVEVALFKLSTDKVMENPNITRTIRHSQGRITEVNSTFIIVVCEGTTEDIVSLFHELRKTPDCVLQFTRSGRIAVTRSCQEEVSKFLHERGEEI
jgi:acetolactate synthase-1/3 small subunit